MKALVAWRPRAVLTTLGLAVVMLVLPSIARATCTSSTPTGVVAFTDTPPGDAQPTAPEILSVEASLDSACRLTVDPKLQADLTIYQVVSIYLGFQPSTGDPATETIDREVRLFQTGDAYLSDGTFPLIPIAILARFGQAGFTATLDELGIPAPTSLGIYVSAIYDNAYPPVCGDEPFDDAPDIDSLMYRLPLAFTQPPPPPPPASPPHQPAPAAKPKATGCVVPKLKGLTVKKAKARLKKAGCKYKLRGKGRVRSFSPKAGTRTTGTVQVKCKRKQRGKKRARR